ncbi:uncharacterized protein LOC122371627 [Amphibalanus amphitrite]|uniref:uncharacterized protein LOC122371627 n=1 Tax=Amphibalanus amphitrite TaxID=1232801 RepID=UPI001C910C86|nr:uncharacterized protein LOC122371627 [Amphibalanus amphitrite]
MMVPVLSDDPGVAAENGEAGFISDLKAGDLLGRTNEELVLLLIQLRRQAAAAAAARDRVSRQLDRAVAEAGGNGRQTEQTERLRAQMARLDSQHQLTRPLITLVDNMLKLSSLRGSRGGPGAGAGGQPPPGETSEPPAATLAPPSGQNGDSQDRPPVTGEEGPVRDSERLLQRQRALQDELTRVKAVLSSSAKTLDETAADNSRLEREMLSLRQRLQAALKATSHGSSYSNEVRALEAEVRRVQRMLSSRQAERRAPGPEESRRSGSVRRPPEEPAPLHRAGSARLPAGYEAQYDEQVMKEWHRAGQVT